MPLVVNGVIITEDENSFKIQGNPILRGFVNGTDFFNGVPAGQLDITADTTLTAGIDFPAGQDISICMAGGGGSGWGGSIGGGNRAGGFAGDIISTTFNVADGTVIPVTIGQGGAGASGSTYGNDGTATIFGSLFTANGGSKSTSVNDYGGSGASRTTCGGTFTDGSKAVGSVTAWGGQAGAFGNASNGRINANTSNAGVSAGSGAAIGNGTVSGAGGRGHVRLTWTPFSATWSGSSVLSNWSFNTSGSLFKSADGNWLTVNSDGTFQNGRSTPQVATSTWIDAGGSGGTLANEMRTDGMPTNLKFDIVNGFTGGSNGNIVGLNSSGGLMRIYSFYSTPNYGNLISLT